MTFSLVSLRVLLSSFLNPLLRAAPSWGARRGQCQTELTINSGGSEIDW